MTQLAIDFAASPTELPSEAAAAVPSVGHGALPPEVYTRTEVMLMLDGPLGRNAKVRCRNRALLVVMWRAGLRVSEALGVRTCDLRPESGGVWVESGKGGKSRLAVMDAEAFEALRPWLDRRVALGLESGPEALVFSTFEGGPIESSYVRHMCRRLRVKAGIGKRVHAHAFRHTHAHELWREGVPERAIQEQLGHVSMGTTDGYLQRLGSAEIVTALQGRPSWSKEC